MPASDLDATRLLIGTCPQHVNKPQQSALLMSSSESSPLDSPDRYGTIELLRLNTPGAEEGVVPSAGDEGRSAVRARSRTMGRRMREEAKMHVEAARVTRVCRERKRERGGDDGADAGAQTQDPAGADDASLPGVRQPADGAAHSRHDPKTPSTTKAAALPFGAPHPARTPRGVGRAAPPEEADTREPEEADIVPMEVDLAENGYTPLYEDLGAYCRAEEDDTAPKPANDKPPAPRPTATRYSLGGVARRVRVEDSPWQVRELVLPPPPATRPPAPQRTFSDAQRAAISEGRQSALKAPDAFFGGGSAGDFAAEVGAGLKRRRGGVLGEAGRAGSAARGEEAVGVEFTGAAREEPQAPIDEAMDAEAQPVVETQTKKSTRALAQEYCSAGGEGYVRVLERHGNLNLLQELVEESEAMDAEPETTTKKPTRGESAMRSRKAIAESKDVMEESELLPVVEPKTSTRAKSTVRPRTPNFDYDMDVDTLAPAKPARRTRKVTRTTAVEESEDMPVDALPAPSEPRRTRKSTGRTRKSTAEPDTPCRRGLAVAARHRRARERQRARRARKLASSTDAHTTAPATDPAVPPKRRGRVKAATPASLPEPAARKPTRGRSRAPVDEPEDAEEERCAGCAEAVREASSHF
ncbi:hypothetical protein DFH09DRAFT_1446483 [Mycena vulgaris]|nr:hypothetical protein DFH09DRAFT_1446483 [Mycena vulgaris]